MNMEYFALMICIGVFGSIGFYIRTKNKERMKLIEKGINPDEGLNITEYRKQSFLKNGVLFLSLSLGLFAGNLLAINYDKLDKIVAYMVMLLLFSGIGFLINYLIIINRNSK